MRATADAPRGARGALHTACGALATAVRWLVIALALAMLSSLAMQVLMRYALDRSPSWTEEFAITCFGWSMLLAIALGVRDGIHVRMDLLVELLPQPAQMALERFCLLLIAACGGFLAWAGVRYAGSTMGVVSAAIGYPLSWLYASAPVSGALVCLFALERVAGYRPPESEPLSAT